MNAVPMTLETLAEAERFDSQIELVREHWAPVRHLWIEGPDVAPAGKLRAGLPEEFYIGAGMPELLLGHELIAEDIELGDRLAAALKPEIWIRRAAA